MENQNMTDPKEVSATEAARMLGIRCDYITMLLRSGKLAGQKVEGQWRVPVRAINERLRQFAGVDASTTEPNSANVRRAVGVVEDRALTTASA